MPPIRRFNNLRPRFSQKKEKKELPLWLQYLSAWSGVILGVASIIVAIWISSQQQEIKDMEKLLLGQEAQLSTLTSLSQTQNTQLTTMMHQLNELKKLDSNSIITSNRIADQTSYLQNTQTPELVPINIDLDTSSKPSIPYKWYALLVTFKNVGGRNALDVDIEYHWFQLKPDGLKLMLHQKGIPPSSISKTIKAQAEVVYTTRFKPTYDIVEYQESQFLSATIKFTDPLTKKRIIKKLYWLVYRSEGKMVLTDCEDPFLIGLMDAFVLANRK